MHGEIINFTNYTPLEILFYGVCAITWFIAYMLIIYNIGRHQFAAILGTAMCGYFAWEILWGYFFTTDMGKLLIWGLKIYAPVSLYIIYDVFKNGSAYFYTTIIKGVSGQYIPLLTRVYEEEGLRGLDKMVYPVAWLKLAANCSGSFFCLLHLPDRQWLHALCFVAIVLNVTYLVALSQSARDFTSASQPSMSANIGYDSVFTTTV
ncbi:MAG: hypothetical protein AAGE59_31860 [Cyanobacteria bacterium P01_F01_bin.86]